ncbi:hypothetical protein FBY34_7105 [Streptomyces sp. SLBN-115]|nr:hypothetical protein FBY34_7105 [Streptomyces sp. SLBN-115]
MGDILVWSKVSRRPRQYLVPLRQLPYQQGGMGARRIVGEVTDLGRDPLVPELPLLLPVPGPSARPGLLGGHVHPQQTRQERAQGAAAGADPLYQDDGGRRERPRRAEAAGAPVVRGVVRGLAAAERLDDLAQQPPGPGEQLVVAGEVVETQDRRAPQRLGEPSGQGGLPRAGVSVDTDQPDRPTGRRQTAQTGGELTEGELMDGGSRGEERGGGVVRCRSLRSAARAARAASGPDQYWWRGTGGSAGRRGPLRP